MTVQYTTKAGKKREKTEYDPCCQQPIFQGRNLCEVKGQRYERRPSKIARRAGKRSVSEMLERTCDEIELPEDWAE